MKWRIMAVGSAAMLIMMAMTLPAGALTKAQLQAKTLSLSDLPAGWTVDHSAGGGVSSIGCLKGLGSVPKHTTRVSVTYTDGQLPTLNEILETGQGSLARFRAYRHELANCTHISISVGKQKVTALIHPVAFATGVSGSSTYDISIKAQGQSFAFEIALFQIGNVVVSFGYAHTGAADPTQMRPFLTAAIEKIKSAA